MPPAPHHLDPLPTGALYSMKLNSKHYRSKRDFVLDFNQIILYLNVSITDLF